jgi:hypothetical protein
MRRSCFRRNFVPLALLAVFSLGCGQEAPLPPQTVGTPELREALFDSILVMTARRGAFSVHKQEALDYDPLEEMETLRSEVVGAETEEALFYALHKMSNARRDRHLSLGLVDGGIIPPVAAGLENWDGEDPPEPQETPVRFQPDFGDRNGGFFVSDVAPGSDAEGAGIHLGQRVVTLNGIPAGDLESTLTPYFRYSSIPGLRWKMAEALSLRTAILPPSFHGPTLELEVEGLEGNRVSTSLPYQDPESFSWTGAAEPSYPGFALEWSTPSHDLYLPVEGQNAIILQWHRFESSSLIEDMDRLVAFGEENGLLDYAVIFDATRSGGGSLGAYAVQRIQPKPFKTTFGTVRVSDVVEPFIQEKREQFQAQQLYDGGGPETVDDGTWLMDWLENDLYSALDRGDSVTVPVPFKLAHAPKDSDGVLQPGPIHFRGPLVVLSGPNGGSHLDQFMSIVADNDLGHIMGMPTGGYSNTWEWEETLYFPGTHDPVIGFMWNIGHSIRPNGEVLEGNPAALDEEIPLTAENAGEYYQILFERAWGYLSGTGFRVSGS